MICKSCATGADLLSRAKEIEQKHTGEGLGLFLKDARAVGKELHRFCTGKYQCDCQHRSQGDSVWNPKEKSEE